ncbi:transcriptional adapter 1-like [Lineus longissimus]|uniref:transcriptional adapter 1-like n=1 Tax=Lineus longissimus TaxID=88925 RepID=UPI002B4E08A6
MSASTELNVAKKNLSDVLGDAMKTYLIILKSWFKQKISREDFDYEARKLLTSETVHLHNEFLLAILSKCQSLASALAPKDVNSSSHSLSSPKQIKKPRLKRKSSSNKASFQQRFVPADPLKNVPLAVVKGPEDEGGIHFCSRELILPGISTIHGRMIVTAWDFGLDNVEDDAVRMMLAATEQLFKNIISAILLRRNGYKLRENRFKYAIGTQAPSSYLRNTNDILDFSTDSHATDISSQGAVIPSIKPGRDIGEMDGATQVACGSSEEPPRRPVNMYDVAEALQVYRSTLPSHTVYAMNMERIIQRLWHPSNEELDQDHIRRQEVAIKQELATWGKPNKLSRTDSNSKHSASGTTLRM